jgi:hypothetical protein
MSDDTWDDYSAAEATTATTSIPEDTAITTDVDSASVASDWADWNTASANEWTDSATEYNNDGVTALESGDLSGAQYDFDHASTYADTAAGYADTASSYADTASSYTDVAAGYDASGLSSADEALDTPAYEVTDSSSDVSADSADASY